MFICLCVFLDNSFVIQRALTFLYSCSNCEQLQVDQKNTQLTSLFLYLSLRSRRLCVVFMCECVEMSAGDEEGGLRILPPSSLNVKKVYSKSAEELQSPEALRSSAMSPDLRQDFSMMEQRKRVTHILQSPVRRHSHTHTLTKVRIRMLFLSLPPFAF